MLDGVALESVAAPPVMDNAKSDTSIFPEPPFVLYAASFSATVNCEFS